MNFEYYFYKYAFYIVRKNIEEQRRKNIKNGKMRDFAFCSEPLINFPHLVKAAKLAGYTAESVVNKPYYITNDFDNIFEKTKYNIAGTEIIKKNKSFHFFNSKKLFLLLNILIVKAFFKITQGKNTISEIDRFIFTCSRFNVLFYSFNGLFSNNHLKQFEYQVLHALGLKTVILPYGADVQDFSLSKNLYEKHTETITYPTHFIRHHWNTKNNIILQTKNATCIVGGCDWVRYMPGWDILNPAYFVIDCEFNASIANQQDDFIDEYLTKYKPDSFKVFHGPNHVHIKGTKFLVKAIEELNAEGYNIEMCFIQGVSNDKILKLMNKCDVAFVQFIIGAYAMTEIEAMGIKIPVASYIADDYKDLMVYSENWASAEECPIINTPIDKVKENLKWCYDNREKLAAIGEKSYHYVKKFHSLESGAQFFKTVAEKISYSKILSKK